MTDARELAEREARKAFTMHVHEAFVCLLWQGADSVPNAVGTGCVLLAGSRPVLLTARHNVFDPKTRERLPPPTLFSFDMASLEVRKRNTGIWMAPRGQPPHLAVLRRDGGTFRIPPVDTFGGRVHTHPECDVALVECKPEHEEQVRAIRPKPVEGTLADASDGARPGEELCAAGVPKETMELDDAQRRLTVPTFVYFTSLRHACPGHDARGLHLDWREARDLNGSTLEPERPFYPHGMSGAAVWRQRLDNSQLFAPAKGTQIVGVVREVYPWHDEGCDSDCDDPAHEPVCVGCESVEDFGPWLRETATKIAAGAA